MIQIRSIKQGLAVAALIAASTSLVHGADPVQGAAVQVPTVEIFGKRHDGVSPAVIERLGGVEGARQWVDNLLTRLELNWQLRNKLSPFSGPEHRDALNALLLDAMLGRTTQADAALVQAVSDLELNEAQYNDIVGSVQDTCELTYVSYRDCNRILVSFQPVGSLARSF